MVHLIVKKLKHFHQKLFSKSMGYYKLNPARYVTNLALLFKDGRSNNIFVCFITYESVYLSFLALQCKQQSFGFQDIAINMKLLKNSVCYSSEW